MRAPFAGIVTSRNIEPGEVVTPTRQAITLSDLSGVKVKIYVGETEIGQVKPGQKADVKVDSLAGKTFEGTVTFISPEGEFTPKIIQTQKERVKLVYLVEVTVPNPNLELKTGMPADAWLLRAQTVCAAAAPLHQERLPENAQLRLLNPAATSNREERSW